jgi:peptidoglycan/LPS O-acetylase OafA/YrhL
VSWSIRAPRLRRVTSSLAYVPEIDGIRFLAIASVFLFHLAGDVLRHSAPDYRFSLESNNVFAVSQCLNFGVQMFFVLSGFVLALPFVAQYLNSGKKVDRKRFYMRRLTRLEPPYFAALILFFVLKVAGGKGQGLVLLPHFGASVLYLHNLIYGRPSDINFVAWSLEIEVQFYLIAPLLAFALYRIQHPGIRRTLLVATCLASSFLASLISGPATLSLARQLPYFVAGFLLADLFSLASIPKARFAWDVVFLSAIPLIVLQIRAGWMLIYFAPLTLCVAYYAAFHSTWISRFLRNPFVSLTGGMCYSIYLVHNYVIAAAGMITESWTASLRFTWRLGAQALLIGPVVLAISCLFYLLVERPCMRPDWPSRASQWLTDYAFRTRKTKSSVLKASRPTGEAALPIVSGEVGAQ